MLTALRQRGRLAAAALGRGLCGDLTIRLHRRPSSGAADPTVHMLVSSKTWHAGLLAAISLEHHSGIRWSFYVHDDGTVDLAARARMERALPGMVFIPRREADERAAAYLGAHPRLLDHRARHNLFLKFFDFPAWAPGPRFLVLDSDVIFFRPPTELLDWARSGADSLRYNEDTKEKYCIPRRFIEEQLGLAMWRNFNSGLVFVPAAAVSLDLADRLVGAFEQRAHHPQFFEQTLYGLMGSAWGRGGPLPRTYDISWGYFRRRGAVCRHYVGDFKHDLLYIEGAPLLLASVLKRRLLRG